MQRAFSIFDQGCDTIVAQPCLITHMSGVDLQSPPPWLVLKAKRHAKQIIQGVTERNSPGPAFAPDPLEDVLIQRDCRSDAHDVVSLTSDASRLAKRRPCDLQQLV